MVTITDSVTDYNELDVENQQLIDAAILTRAYAYSPYSNFKVGAAIRTKCGKIFTGCNVESSSFTPTSCAERTAICKAISEGYSDFVSCAVVAYQENVFTSPCGVCRQMLMEFAAEDFPVFVAKAESPVKSVLCTSVHNLLPNGNANYK